MTELLTTTDVDPRVETVARALHAERHAGPGWESTREGARAWWRQLAVAALAALDEMQDTP